MRFRTPVGITHLLPGQPGRHGGGARNDRLFIDAVLFVARTGTPWEDTPARLGNRSSQWRRFDRWAKANRWNPILVALPAPDLDVLVFDSAAVRAQPRAAGAKKLGRVWRPGRSGGDRRPRVR